jgi:hypothetical protein
MKIINDKDYIDIDICFTIPVSVGLLSFLLSSVSAGTNSGSINTWTGRAVERGFARAGVIGAPIMGPSVQIDTGATL